MQVTVLVEAVNGTGYRASSGQPLALSAEGATADEALRKLRELLTARTTAGARLVQLDIPAADNPWLQVVGMYADDPLFDEWQEAIAERRREMDADPDVL